MRTAVIIPTPGPWHQSALTKKCVATLLLHHPPTTELVVIENTTNIYHAWNAGAEQTEAPTIIFLNNDTITHAPWIPQLTQLLQHAAITGIRLRTERALPHNHPHQNQQFLEGWCFACRRTTWAANPFDTTYELYFGDTDFQARAPGPLLANPTLATSINHIGHQSTRLRPDRISRWKADRATHIAKWSTPDAHTPNL